MRNNYKRLQKMMTLLFAFLLIGAHTNATTFTALASGNFSSSTSWTGGVVPSNMQQGDEIVIPLGINITLDQDLEIQSTSKLTVIGKLMGNTGNYLSLKSGATLAGAGTITVDSIATNLSSGLTFTGTVTAKAFYSTNAMVNAATQITVNNTLYLAGGTMDLVTGSLKIGQNATIMVDGGMMTVSGGSADLTADYMVMYMGNTDVNTGVELTGSGLTDITINTMGSNEVKLTSDLMVNGTLKLSTGVLSLNSHNLTINTNGDIDASGSGMISSTSSSDIMLMSSGSLSGGLTFTSGGNTVNNLTVNMGSNTAMAKINSDLMINGKLDLQKGQLNIGSNKLELMSSAMLSGGSSNSFVITGKDGWLSMKVAGNSSQTFHIGTMQHYAPVKLTSSSSSADSKFSLSFNGGVMQQGTMGPSISATQPVVNGTWYVKSSATANIDVDMQVMWDASMEVNSFDRTNAYISHYTNAKWDSYTKASATMSNGMYSITRTGISSFSPFAVFDGNTAASVNEVHASDQLAIYPNPATNTIRVATGNNTETLQANIYNVSGQVVQHTTVSGKTATLNISNLPTGMYYLKLKGAHTAAAGKFMKR